MRRFLPPETGLDLPRPQEAHGPVVRDLADCSGWASFLRLAGPLAPGNAATLAELRGPACRPAAPHPALASEVLLRRAKKGAAPGPSDQQGLCFIVKLTQIGFGRLARAEVPPEVVSVLGLGRLVALQKRALFVSDVFWRHLAAGRSDLGSATRPRFS